MDEAAIRLEVQHLIRDLGFWDYHPADDVMKRAHIVNSRPDIYGLNPKGATVVIEVKRIDPKERVEPWFHPADISDGQRNWLDMWVYDSGGQGFLGIGTIEAPRRLWIIPWQEWVEMEYKKAEKDLHFRITLSDLNSDRELTKVVGGWVLPLYHPLLGIALASSSPTLYIGKTKPHSLRFSKKEGENEIA